MSSDVQLVRLDNCLWAFDNNQTEERKEEEITFKPYSLKYRLRTPNDEPDLSYKLADMVLAAFQDITSIRPDGRPIILQCSSQEQDIHGRWRLQREEALSCWQKQKQQIPFTKKIFDERIVTYTLERESCSIGCRNSQNKVINVVSSSPTLSLSLGHKLTYALKASLERDPFADPFTVLATKAFQTEELSFVSEAEPQGTFRYVLNKDHNEVRLVKIEDRDFTEAELEENCHAIQAYQYFLSKEYGDEYVKYVETNYGFNLNEMKLVSSPLYPDHIFKMNIGMNNIEMSHIESLYHKLRNLQVKLVNKPLEEDKNSFWGEFAEIYVTNMRVTSKDFSIRELRSIYNELGPNASNEDLKLYLEELLGNAPSSVRELSPQQFSKIVEMVFANSEARKRAFTGREIKHLAICGYNTMGDPNVPNPSRDLFELLHVFSDLEKEDDWFNFYELLSHIVVKKSLFRGTSHNDGHIVSWGVGLLIPAPKTTDVNNSEERRWYYNDAFCDDDRGNVNYVLLPACNNYLDSDGTLIPMIKLYRSTASNRNAVNWLDSIRADLNPDGGPGSLDPNSSFNYEKKHFDERTIPLWVGYLVLAEKLLETGDSSGKIGSYFYSAINEYVKYAKQQNLESHAQIEAFKLSKIGTNETIYKFLTNESQRLKEHPSNKIAQNITFLGHSLGGSLAQFGLHFFGAKRDRIPLPNVDFACYAFDPPAIKDSVDVEFMNFGRKHRELIVGLGQKWAIRYLMEYGDIVPIGGGGHLGTIGYEEQSDDWLDFGAHIFKPNDRAEDLSMTTAPTHGRRIGLAIHNRDFKIERIEPKILYNFDYSWWLDERLRRIFGYKIVNSPQILEYVRRVGGQVLQPILACAERVYNCGRSTIGRRDDNGVMYLRYQNQVTKT